MTLEWQVRELERRLRALEGPKSSERSEEDKATIARLQKEKEKSDHDFFEAAMKLGTAEKELEIARAAVKETEALLREEVMKHKNTSDTLECLRKMVGEIQIALNFGLGAGVHWNEVIAKIHLLKISASTFECLDFIRKRVQELYNFTEGGPLPEELPKEDNNASGGNFIPPRYDDVYFRGVESLNNIDDNWEEEDDYDDEEDES